MNNQAAHEAILFDGDYYDALVANIDSAKHSIDLEVYIFESDLVGEAVAAALSRAASRGVRVRVLVDGVGTPYHTELIASMEQTGVCVRVYHPFPWHWWHWNRANFHSTLFYKFIYLLSRLNKRNHRKTCVIDQQIVYVSSANITNKSLPEARGGENWRDVTVRLEYVNTNELNNAFNIAWDGFSVDERIQQTFHRVNVHALFRLNYAMHLRRVLYRNLLYRLSKSSSRIWLVNAYFNPDYFLLRKLIKAAKRGVDVKLILPMHSDVFIMPWVASTFYYSLIKHNINIYEYYPSMLHSKITMIDDWMTIGSSNLNYRSLRHDLEVDVVIQSDPARASIEAEFLEMLQFSRRVGVADLQKLSWSKRFFGRILLFIRYFL